MKTYDFKKAKKIIKENVSKIKEVSIGMHEDWFWTAETIWKDGKFTKKLNNDTEIGGIRGSSWATPVICLRFKNGKNKMLECFSGESSGNRPNHMMLGALSAPVQNNITPISKK